MSSTTSLQCKDPLADLATFPCLTPTASPENDNPPARTRPRRAPRAVQKVRRVPRWLQHEHMRHRRVKIKHTRKERRTQQHARRVHVRLGLSGEESR
jgi:hypothetical protein